MTYEEIATMIEDISIESAYYQFPEGTAVDPPFLCWYFAQDDDMFADNTNYVKIKRLVVELYTSEKELLLEEQIGAALNQRGIPYQHYENYIDQEKLIMNTFEGEVVING